MPQPMDGHEYRLAAKKPTTPAGQIEYPDIAPIFHSRTALATWLDANRGTIPSDWAVFVVETPVRWMPQELVGASQVMMFDEADDEDALDA